MADISLEILNSIKEVQYVTGTEPELDLLIFNKRKNIDCFVFDYTWMVYLETEKGRELIMYKHSSSSYKNRLKYPFVDCLLSIEEIDLNSLILLCTIFNITVDSNINRFDHYSKTSTFLKPFTEYSDGWILYHHQALNLFQLLTGCSDIDAKDWLLKMNDGQIEAKVNAMVIDLGDTNFFEIWKEHTIYGRTWTPKRKEAEILYHFIYSSLINDN